jgi:hypothetical protein
MDVMSEKARVGVADGKPFSEKQEFYGFSYLRESLWLPALRGMF